jgi:hypothetical protein
LETWRAKSSSSVLAAPALVASGLGPEWLDQLAASFDPEGN